MNCLIIFYHAINSNSIEIKPKDLTTYAALISEFPHFIIAIYYYITLMMIYFDLLLQR